MIRIIAKSNNKQECFLIHGLKDYEMITKLTNRHAYFTKEHYEYDYERSNKTPFQISIGSMYYTGIIKLINYHKEQQINKTIEDVLK